MKGGGADRTIHANSRAVRIARSANEWRKVMRFKGDVNVEALSDLLKDESDRCVVIVAAAFFDETLARLLGDRTDQPLNSRINDGSVFRLPFSCVGGEDLEKFRRR